MAAIGWFGPLIDLSKASSHIGDYVQLLVLVHKFTPVQYKLLNGGEVVRTDIQVGDDTRPFFSVSIWQKQMGSTIVAGSVILLQNVKVTRFGDVVEARTVQHSSIQCLVHTYDSLFSKGADNFIEDCHVGITTKAKLKKVVLWVRRAGPTLSNIRIQSYKKKQSSTNWKVHEETPSQYFFSLSDVLLITNSCKATFFASVGEIFLPITWKNFSESEDERMFIRRRLYAIGDNYLAEDFICSGCQHCGVPLNSELGFNIKQGTNPLYCQKSSNHHHLVSLIYRPFQLYVWDESQYIPLLVTNKAAELLFGNISAESVYSRYNREKHCQMLDSKIIHITAQPNDAERESTNLHPSNGDKSAEETQKYDNDQNRNTYLIWLILLKTLLQRGRNNPLKFRVRVDATKDWESGRFELVSLSIPCCSPIDSSSLIKETPRNVDAPSNSRNAL